MSGILPKVIGSSQEKPINNVPGFEVLHYNFAEVLADRDEVGVKVVADFVERVQPFPKGFEQGFGRVVVDMAVNMYTGCFKYMRMVYTDMLENSRCGR